MRYFISIIITIIILTSCKIKESSVKEVKSSVMEQPTTKNKAEKDIILQGVLRMQGMTTYQYGTHILKTKKKSYALRSKDIDLDTFISKSVEIMGQKIEGYPVSGGPDYIKVVSIKEKK